MLSWHLRLKQKAAWIHNNANMTEPRAQTRLLTEARDRNCCNPVWVLIYGVAPRIWANPIVLKIKRLSLEMDLWGTPRRGRAEYRASLENRSPLCSRWVGHLAACTRSDTPTRMQTYAVVHTETIRTTKESVLGQPVWRWTAQHCYQPWALLGVWQCDHSFVTDDSETASSQDSPCDQHLPSHWLSVGFKGPGMHRYGNTMDVDQ